MVFLSSSNMNKMLHTILLIKLYSNQYFIFYIWLHVFMDFGGTVHMLWHVWKSENRLEELVFFFCHGFLEIRVRLSGVQACTCSV